jgi:hypothetical protein
MLTYFKIRRSSRFSTSISLTDSIVRAVQIYSLQWFSTTQITLHKAKKCFWLWPFGLWHRAMLYVITNVSEEIIASILRFTSTLHMEALRPFEKLVITYNITRRHNPEDHNPQFHGRENLKSHTYFVIYKANQNTWSAWKMLIRGREGKRSLGRSTRWWKNNVKIYMKGIGCEGVDGMMGWDGMWCRSG